MNEVLQSEIARLVDSGYELTVVTPDGSAELQREGELVRLRLQRGYVTATHGLRVAPPVDPPKPPPPGGEVIRSRPGRVAVFGDLGEEDLRPAPPDPRRGSRFGVLSKVITALVLVALVLGAYVFSRVDNDAPGEAASDPGARLVEFDRSLEAHA